MPEATIDYERFIKPTETRRSATTLPAGSEQVDRCRKYLDKMPNAISGQGGHNATLAAACKCVEFGLIESETWGLMSWFNDSKCQPSWSEKELQHKITDAYKKASRNPEYMERRFERDNDRQRLDKEQAQDAEIIPANNNHKKSKPGKVLPAIATNEGKEYAGMTIPEPSWIMKGQLCEGLTICSGAFKLGKSWMMLDLCLSVAAGNKAFGGIETCQHHTLYLALEDGKRRIKSRLAILGNRHNPIPDGVKIAHELLRLDEGGLEQIDKVLADDPLLKLVVLDVWQKVRPPRKSGESDYEGDYRSLSAIKKIADDRHVAIVLVHHIRKMEAVDPHERVNGSVAITGCADCSWVLMRGRGENTGELHITGRDVEEQSLAMSFDGGLWTWEGDLKDVRRTNTNTAIHNTLVEWGPRTPAEVAVIAELPRNTVKQAMNRMEKGGLLTRELDTKGKPTGEYRAVTTGT